MLEVWSSTNSIWRKGYNHLSVLLLCLVFLNGRPGCHGATIRCRIWFPFNPNETQRLRNLPSSGRAGCYAAIGKPTAWPVKQTSLFLSHRPPPPLASPVQGVPSPLVCNYARSLSLARSLSVAASLANQPTHWPLCYPLSAPSGPLRSPSGSDKAPPGRYF